MNSKISILLPAYKSETLLAKVFLKGHINPSNTELIIYDNGGNGLTEEFKEDVNAYGKNNPDLWKGIKLDDTPLKCHTVFLGKGENIGLNTALNECTKVATGDYFYLCHTDMHLMPGWDIALLEACKNLPPASFLLCSRSIEKSSHIPMQLLKDFGTSLDNFKEKELYDFFETYKDKGIVTSYRMPFFGHRKLFEKLTEYNTKNKICDGPFDSSFFSYATDNDLFFNCYEIGVRKFWMVQESVVYHLSGHSNKQQNIDRGDFMPYQKLIDKWSKRGYNITANIDASEQQLVPWNLKIK